MYSKYRKIAASKSWAQKLHRVERCPSASTPIFECSWLCLFKWNTYHSCPRKYFSPVSDHLCNLARTIWFLNLCTGVFTPFCALWKFNNVFCYTSYKWKHFSESDAGQVCIEPDLIHVSWQTTDNSFLSKVFRMLLLFHSSSKPDHSFTSFLRRILTDIVKLHQL